MQLSLLFYTGVVLAPAIGLAAPVAQDEALAKRENLCNLSAPPALCKPDPSVTVQETAKRAYQFYRAFVVDGDPRTMFSLIDSTYTVRPLHYVLPNSEYIMRMFVTMVTTYLPTYYLPSCTKRENEYGWPTALAFKEKKH
jgi:hypothetical protein